MAIKPPKGLGNRGRALFTSLQKALPYDDDPQSETYGEQLEFDEREIAILRMVARLADQELALEKVEAKYGPMVEGSKGQLVMNPATPELRQNRIAQDRLMGDLSIPDEAGEPRTAASRRAQNAANAKQDQLAARRERRGHRVGA